MISLRGKRLVIFGCGYVGAAVARVASAAGARVTGLTRNAVVAEALRAEGLAMVVADLATDAWHREIAGAPDFALNCVSSGGGGVDGYRHSYLGGMDSILRWSRSAGPIGTLIYTSSTSVYPQGDGAYVDETFPANAPGERPQVLIEAENRLRTEAAAQCWFILRLAGIYGPGRHHLVEQVRMGEVSGKGDTRLNLIHRDDIVAAVTACFGSDRGSRVFNLADDGAATKAEIVTWLAERLALPVPRFTGEPAGGRRTLTPDRVIVNAKAKAELGWRPRFPTFREGYASLLSR